MIPRKKAIHYLSRPFLSFTENWIHTQIKNAANWESVVYCTRSENAELFPVGRMRVFDWSSRTPASLFNRAGVWLTGVGPAVAAAMEKDGPSLLHAHFGPSGWDALPLKRRFGVPLITTFYGYDLTLLPAAEPVWKRRYRRLFEEGDLFLVEGGHMRRRLIELGCPAGKAVVQHLGVDVGAIPFRSRARDASGEIKILAAAAFTEKKGLPYAVEAFGRVARAHPDWKLGLTIVGGARGSAADAEEKRRILRAIEASGVRSKVALLGFRTQAGLHAEFYKHHLFLSPSVTAKDGNTEGGAPVSIIEATATGMPVISTTHCDIPELVVDGAGGLLAPERDSAALAENLEYLAGNPSLWPEFGRAGRAHIEEEYDCVKLGPTLERFYAAVGG